MAEDHGMPTDRTADQPPETDAGRALALLANTMLDPLFRPQARSGIASAWHAHVPFAQWLVAATRPALIVELGTHNGVSYAAFCETVLQERLAARCYAVDSWAGDDHAGHYDESVYTLLREFHDGRYSAFSELLRMTFDEARDVIPDGSVDLLHIDGFHSYESVRHDFEGWAPKLSPRGVVLFHDINVLERGFGVARFWAEVAARFPSFSFLHGHGLGVLAAGPDVPPAIRSLCATEAPSAVAVLRERFASLGRAHALDYALGETARHEQRLRHEAAEREALVDSLRRSLDEVLRHRDELLAAQAPADQRLPSQEVTITDLRQALRETELSLEAAREHAVRQEAAAQDHARQIDERDRSVGDLRAEAAEVAAELARLRAEIEGLWGNLSAARADAKAAREDGRVEATRLQAEIDTLRAAAEAGRTAPRTGFGLRSRRH
jgi:Methyltransferase domain